MKKRLSAVLATTALIGVASAYAANPFPDVTPDTWAYQAVSTLAAEGIVTGYPDGYFNGERNISRYEMAHIISRAITKDAKASAEQRAMLVKLVSEFRTEIDNLDGRVSDLEERIGRFAFSGESEYKMKKAYVMNSKAEGSHTDTTGELKLNIVADVNDKTKAGVRLVTKMGFGDAGWDKTVIFDRMWLKHNFGSASLTVGRQEFLLGSGLQIKAGLDGAVLAGSYKNVNYEVGYGYGYQDGLRFPGTVVYGQIGFSPLAHTQMKMYYGRESLVSFSYHEDEMGVSLDYNHNNIQVGGEWSKNIVATDNTGWTAYVGYGNYDQAHAGTWSLTARYFNLGLNFKGQHTGFTDVPYGYYDYSELTGRNYIGWGVNASYALADNLGLSVDYYFAGKPKVDIGEKTDFGSSIVTKLNCKF